MYLRTVATVAAITLISGIARADISGTITLTSDYDFRGFSQSATDVAIQGSIDYAHDSGFYASAWGSSLDFGEDIDADIEMDYIAGFSREFGDSGVAWDVGYIAYTYPGFSSINYSEFYGGLNIKSFNVKASYSDDFAGVGHSAWYLDGGFSHEWESGWSVLIYGGYNFGKTFDESHGLHLGIPEFWNYGAGVGYSLSNFYFEAKAVGTDLSAPYKTDSGVFANDLRGVFSVTVSLP